MARSAESYPAFRSPDNNANKAARARLAALLLGQRHACLPLTATQEGMWLAEQLSPGHSAYHDTAVLRLSGPLDEAALRNAVGDVQRQHEALRCRIISSDGVPRQTFDVGMAGDNGVDWRRVQASAGPSREESQVRRLAALDGTEPFDLRSGPLWRVRLVSCAADRNYLIVVLHHLVTDGWSHGVFLQALLTAYLARQRGDHPAIAAGHGYSDWISGRLRREEEAVRSGQARTVAHELRGIPRLPPLPGLLPEPSGRRAESVAVPLTAGQWQDFGGLCASLGATPYMGATGIFGQLLCDIGQTGSVLLSSPVADRADPASAALIGCMINVVPVRVCADTRAPVQRAILAGKRAMTQALARSALPYRAIVRAADTAQMSQDPLTALAIEEFNAPVAGRAVGSLRVEPLGLGPVLARHALTLSVVRDSAQPLRLVYPSGQWQAAAVPDIAAALARRLAGRTPREDS